MGSLVDDRNPALAERIEQDPVFFIEAHLHHLGVPRP